MSKTNEKSPRKPRATETATKSELGPAMKASAITLTRKIFRMKCSLPVDYLVMLRNFTKSS